VTFHSPPEYVRSGAVEQIFTCSTSSRAVCFPSAFSWWRAATHPRVNQLWVLLPSQRFSRSQGFAPPAICRPCFMPVPPMGFPFRADFHPQSSTFFRTPIPSCGSSTSGFCSLRASLSPRKQSLNGDSDPHGIRLPRGLFLFAVVQGPSSLELGGQQASWLTIALQSLADEKIGLALSSLPPLSRFSHLIGSSSLREVTGSGLLLGSPRCHHPEFVPLRTDQTLPELSELPFR
jgi:hypothetical protein